MRFRIKVLLCAAGGLALLPVPASGVAMPPDSSAFSGYATGSALHVNALQIAAAGPVIENTAVAFSGASVNSQRQTTPINNEMGLGVQPVNDERETYGRGSGIEAGLGKGVPQNPDTNQVILPGIAEAGALPLFTAGAGAAPAPINEYQTGVKTVETLKQSVNPVAYASVLRGQAQAMWNPDSALAMLGNPLGFGLGYADDVQLINRGAAPTPEGDLMFPAPLLATDTAAASGERTTSQSMSFNYLVNNGDGTCGLASETRITMAPLRLNLQGDADPTNDLTIEVLGEWILRATATGKADGTVTFQPAKGPATNGDREPILRTIQNGEVTNRLTFQDLFGAEGRIIEVAPAISIAIGEDPRGIQTIPTANPDEKTKPTTTMTEASGAVDIVRVRLLPGVTTAAGLNLLDLRLGHFETKAVVPEGGLNCEIPVRKEVTPNPAQAGDTLTFTIFIPSSDRILVPFPCDLAAIRVVDTHSIKSGNPRFTVLSGTGPNGEVGVVDGDTITFPDIGSYVVGNPPLEAKVLVRLAANSGPGELRDVADVTALAANCKAQANAVGRAIGAGGGGGLSGLSDLAGLTGSGLAGGGGAGLRGQGELDGPTVPPRELPRTGPSDNLPVAAAAFGFLAVMGMRNLRRRSIA